MLPLKQENDVLSTTIKNMSLLKYLLFFFLTCYCLNTGFSQHDYFSKNATMRAYVKKKADRNWVRWIPGSTNIFENGRNYGYKIERRIIDANGNGLSEKSLLTPVPLKAPSFDDILVEAQTDDDFEEIAYGFYFDQLSEAEKQEVYSQEDDENNLTEQQLQIYGLNFAFFMIGYDFDKALYTGTGFEDISVSEGVEYEYTIHALDKSGRNAESITISTLEAFPSGLTPSTVEGYFKSGYADIAWSTHATIPHFHSYYVERSDDEGKNFIRKPEYPMINVEDDKPQENLHYIFHADSLYKNYKMYVYRVKGVDYFGEISPKSNEVKGYSYAKCPAPVAIGGKPVEDNKAYVEWYFEEGYDDLITGFNIYNAPIDTGKMELVMSDIPVDQRNATPLTKWTANFYRVEANTKDGPKLMTSTMLVMRIDSIPPDPPTGLIGEVDEKGNVKINWDTNDENDFLGYRVYRGNTAEEEFAQLTVDPIPIPTFEDKIWINTLTEEIFYKVTAIDTRYNISKFSTTLELKRPDVVPPAPPNFSDYQKERGRNILYWNHSPNDDVVAVKLFRKQVNVDNEWVLEKEFDMTDSIQIYVDSLVEKNEYYAYTLIAMDDAGLESEPSTPIVLEVFDDGFRPPIESFNADYNEDTKKIMLNWDYEGKDLYEFWIYRAEAEDPMTLFRTTDENARTIEDDLVRKDLNYRYTIKAKFKNGAETPFSQEIRISSN